MIMNLFFNIILVRHEVRKKSAQKIQKIVLRKTRRFFFCFFFSFLFFGIPTAP